MSNYGRGWGSGYGSQKSDEVEAHWDREAALEGDWGWLEKSPRQRRLREEQGLDGDSYADDK